MNGGYESSSDEEVSLSNLKLPDLDPFSYDSLCQKSVINCEFCEKTFCNRLSVIKHNQKHIIIPLIRQSLIQCPTCLYFFNTWKSFNEHNLNKHEQTKKKIHLRNLIKFEEDLEINCDHSDADATCDETIVLSSDDEIEIVSSCYDSNKDESLMRIGHHKCLYCNMLFLTRYDLLTHNLCHIKVNSELHLCKYCETYFETKIKLKNHINIKHPGQFQNATLRKCRDCNLIYNSWIKHHSKYHSIYICNICTTKKYFKKRNDYVSHMNIHYFDRDFIECDKCGDTISKPTMKDHEYKEHKSLNVCHICTLSIKCHSDVKYKEIGTQTATGEDWLTCEKCSNLFLKVNILRKMTCKPYMIRKVKREPKTNEDRLVKRKPKTNEDRLKNIQKRLKKINKY